MRTTEIQGYLDSWGKEFVKRARLNLQEGNKGGGFLEKSISFNVVKDEDGFVVELMMAGYGTFQDLGVKGAGGVLKSGKYPGAWGGRRWYIDWQGKRRDAPYKYGNRTGPIGGMRLGLAAFIAKKGIVPIKGTLTGLRIAMTKVIWTRGIHGIYFFQEALKEGLKGFTDELADNVAEDIIDNLTDHPRIERA
jgi:hypothetical protein